MQKHSLSANKRNPEEKLSKIRPNSTPANVFGPDVNSTSIQVSTKEFLHVFQDTGESALIYLQLDKKEITVMVEEVQWHHIKDLPIHISFKVLSLSEKTEASIPVEIVGEIEIPEAVLVVVRDEIDVRALPTDLPEKFVVSVDHLTEIGQSITLADLEFDQNKIDLVVGDEGDEAPIVLIQEVKEEPEEEEEVETEIIGEDDGEVVAEEGEAPKQDINDNDLNTPSKTEEK